MKNKNKRIIVYVIVGFLLFLTYLEITEAYPIYVKPKVDGQLQPNTLWEYNFSFTNDSACTDILVSNATNITTGADGIGFFDLNISQLKFVPNYLCEYRNDTLRLNKAYPDMIFQNLFAKNITTEGFINISAAQSIQGNVVTIAAPSGGIGFIINNDGDVISQDINITGDLNVEGLATLDNVLIKDSGPSSLLIRNETSNSNYVQVSMSTGGERVVFGDETQDATVIHMSDDKRIVMVTQTQESTLFEIEDNALSQGNFRINGSGSIEWGLPLFGPYDVTLQRTGTEEMNLKGSLNVTNNFTTPYYVATDGTKTMSLTEANDDLTMDVDVGGSNFFSIETDGAFLQLYGNPGPSNDDLMFTITETQGADTEMNFYEGGDGNNRFWSSGSARFGGKVGSTCDLLDVAGLVDCNTGDGEGTDIVVADKILGMGGGIFGNGTTINITNEGRIDMPSITEKTFPQQTGLAIINDQVCFFDDTRNVWLSVTEHKHDSGNQGTSANVLRPAGRPNYQTDLGHYKTAKYVITGFELSADNNPQAPFDVKKNATTIIRHNWATKAYANYTANVSVEANYVLNMDIGSPATTNPDYPIVSVYWRWHCE